MQMGGNDNIAGFDKQLHALGSSDANLHIFTKAIADNSAISVPLYEGETTGPVPTKVNKVNLTALLNVIVLDALNLSPHDVYVCFKYKDPFSYFMPGYFGDKYLVEGKVSLNLDPTTVKMPFEKPAFYKRHAEHISDDELVKVLAASPVFGQLKHGAYG